MGHYRDFVALCCFCVVFAALGLVIWREYYSQYPSDPTGEKMKGLRRRVNAIEAIAWIALAMLDSGNNECPDSNCPCRIRSSKFHRDCDRGRLRAGGLMKKYLIGITILIVATTLFGYAFIHGTPGWLRLAAQVGVVLLLILGSLYTIFPPKDGRIRSGVFIIIFPPSWQRWLLDEPLEKGKQIF